MTPDDLIEQLTPPERHAVALIVALIAAHNSVDGVGMFSGAGRYIRLEERARLEATKARDLRHWWSGLHRSMQLPMTPMRLDTTILPLLLSEDDGAVLRILADRTSAMVMVARVKAKADAAARRGTFADYNAPLDDPERRQAPAGPTADPLDNPLPF